MKGMCNDCEKRDKCKTLCNKALRYVLQDSKELRELNVGKIKYLNYDSIWPDLITKNERRLVYEMAFIDHLSVSEISFHVRLSEAKIFKLVNKLIDSVPPDMSKKKNNILKMHFQEGFTLTQAARAVGVSKPYSHDVIKEYLNSNEVY